MSKKAQYGQYCPLAMSAEFLCNRWTLLVIRELLFGSTGFNEISRGVPRMSRTLLSTRLKELTDRGVVTRREKRVGGQVHYSLTSAGLALGPVVFSMAEWGQEWLEVEPAVQNVDVGFLMWDIHRNAVSMPELPSPFIVEFYLNNVPENKRTHWLVFEDDVVDLCHIDHGFSVHVQIEASIEDLTKAWMGWIDMSDAINTNKIIFKGPAKYTDIAITWLGSSSVAHIAKRVVAERI
ncbi:MAG: helix-turn-helix transcriptional regulator [Pseudomonadales bacterium]|nr:helix-turn-helix transcriptional regulator [Pseudomonadales bacterium]